MQANEVPVSPDDSTVAHNAGSVTLVQAVRIGMVCVFMVLCLATPARVGASPASPLLTTSSAPGDNDSDGIPDGMDPDDDGDTVSDDLDHEPVDPGPPPEEAPDIIAPDQDTDNDGIENIMDPDDDNDAVEDDEDPAPFTPVPPVDVPEAPEVEVPAPEQPARPEVVEPTRPEAAEPVRPEVDAPEPVAPQSRPEANAPLVLTLPTTGGSGTIYTGSSLAVPLLMLSLVSGATSLMLWRRRP